MIEAHLAACSQPPVHAAGPPSANTAALDPLVATIAALDSAMFAAFNADDAAALSTFFTPDLEFCQTKRGHAT